MLSSIQAGLAALNSQTLRCPDRSWRPAPGPGRDGAAHLCRLCPDQVPAGYPQFPEPARSSLAGRAPALAKNPGAPRLHNPAPDSSTPMPVRWNTCRGSKHPARPGYAGRLCPPTTLIPLSFPPSCAIFIHRGIRTGMPVTKNPIIFEYDVPLSPVKNASELTST